MKKILFLFLLIFITHSFATITCERKVIRNSPVDSFSCAQLEQRSGVPEPTTCRTTNVNYHYYVSNKTSILQYEYDGLTCPNSPIYPNVANDSFCYSNDGDNVTCINSLENGSFDDDGIRCNSGHSLTGMGAGIPACMPNPENGTWDDNDDLQCNEGYAKNNDNNTCEPSSGNNTGGVDTNPNNTWQKALDESKANGTYSVSNNGTQNFTVGGNNYSLTSDGILTTTYPDGTSSVQQVDFSNGGSSTGGTGSTGGGSGTSGGNSGNTTNENNTTPPIDTPIDNTPVANSCNDSNLTLQEKMLCELNAGMKKQNSENAPENSLNQLLKDLKTSNQTDNTALNTNIKATNTSLDSIKTLSQNQLNKQTEANTTLNKINDSANATELYNKVMTEDLNKLVNNTQDEEGKSYLGTITDFVKSLTTPTTDEDKNSYSNQINSKVTNTLSSTFSKYSNVLGFGSSYASAPDNITLTLFEHEYILIDFSILNPYVDVIRSLFLTLSYLYGFMNLLRSSR
ncbi:hypothetical protein AVENP_1489 [Arcobacter venerupis]|uniref:Uncharacterized protein n=1 Tax=Arcobacter venerupis TaxID=1054033 RepID=A0AAE7B9F1_9BACT|nr:hypothetical protein [Arcobacter venerupis]QKF67041.1 hypothetical protein AVENP_1489 [Arcobacter venerupis]RWS50013.1 hypothetical protein CKA56_05910 [Arcobacter venerupis]